LFFEFVWLEEICCEVFVFLIFNFQILVATPGRLLDHIENKSGISVRLMGLQMLVLDEADHLLDLGFRKDIEKIVDCLPRQRQSLLFSATMPKEVRLG
jgi:ATP-dependent RNA helicase MSS116